MEEPFLRICKTKEEFINTHVLIPRINRQEQLISHNWTEKDILKLPYCTTKITSKHITSVLRRRASWITLQHTVLECYIRSNSFITKKKRSTQVKPNENETKQVKIVQWRDTIGTEHINLKNYKWRKVKRDIRAYLSDLEAD